MGALLPRGVLAVDAARVGLGALRLVDVAVRLVIDQLGQLLGRERHLVPGGRLVEGLRVLGLRGLSKNGVACGLSSARR